MRGGEITFSCFFNTHSEYTNHVYQYTTRMQHGMITCQVFKVTKESIGKGILQPEIIYQESKIL